MASFLTRISLRAQKVLESFAGKESVKIEDLVKKIDEVQGMGFRVAKEIKEIAKYTHPKPLPLKSLLEEAYFNAIMMGHSYVGTEHLLLAGLILSNFPKVEEVKIEVQKANSLSVTVKNLKMGAKNSYLALHAVDLTNKYTNYPNENLVEREELTEMFTILLQKHNPNVMLIGEEGSGKRSLIEMMVQKVLRAEVPRDLLGAYVLDFSYNNFLASLSSSSNAYESALKDLANEVSELGNVIMVVRRLPNLVMMSAFRQFVEFLNSVGVRFVVCSEDEPGSEELLAIFSVVEVAEPPKKIVLEILKSEAKSLEKFFGTEINQQVINYVYEKAKNLLVEQSFPQKGIFILDRACSLVAFEETKLPADLKNLIDAHTRVEERMAESFVSKDYDQADTLYHRLTNIESKVSKGFKNLNLQMRPITKLDIDRVLKEIKEEEDEKDEEKGYKLGAKKLTDLEKRLKQRIIGQDKAVEVVAKALIRSQMGLRAKNKPVGNFLFLGPTGVGKTELAKVLAQEAFGEDSLIRLDMSDFGEKHTVSRLVGAPPGYIGYNEGGELTTKIARKPQSVVLFDEIEKAHPEVMNILLQIMDEGQLSDMRGEVYDFSKAVIVLTSNLGTDSIHKRDIGYGGGQKSSKEIEDRIMQSVKNTIKPELLNRFDEIVIFRQLETSDASKILDLLLKEVYANLAEKGISFKAGTKVKEYLLQKGFSKEFGARALRRTIEKELLDKIAAHLLLSDKKSLNTSHTPRRISVEVGEGGLVVKG